MLNKLIPTIAAISASIVTVVNAATLSGSASITPQDYYGLPAAALANNPPACGMPYNQLNLARITAVQNMDTSSTCNLCLKIVNTKDTSKFVYVLAVDMGGSGLDLSIPAFEYLFDQRYDASPATWSTVDDSYCAGIYTPGKVNPNQGIDAGSSTTTTTKKTTTTTKKATTTTTKKATTTTTTKPTTTTTKKTTVSTKKETTKKPLTTTKKSTTTKKNTATKKTTTKKTSTKKTSTKKTLTKKSTIKKTTTRRSWWQKHSTTKNFSALKTRTTSKTFKKASDRKYRVHGDRKRRQH